MRFIANTSYCMNNIKSIFLGFLLGLLILFILIVSVTFIYEDEVSQYIVEEVNQNLNAKIDVEEINFSLLRKFPNASLEFKSVTAYSSSLLNKTILGYHTDTLFFAKRLFLELNLFDLIRKNYKIKNIHFDKGIINVFIDQYGNENYRFWNSDNEKAESSVFLELSKVRITQSNILFCNEKNQLIIDSYINKSALKGLFQQDNFTLEASLDTRINNLEIQKSNYIACKMLLGDLSIAIGNNNIYLSNSFLNLESVLFNVDGNIQLSEQVSLNLAFNAENQSLEKILGILPGSIRNEFSDIYARGGIISITSLLTGIVSESSNPLFEGNFDLKKANLVDLKTEINLKQVFANGVFSNGSERNLKTTTVSLTSFSATLDKSTIVGSTDISDFTNPTIIMDYDANLDFAEIQNTFAIDTLEVFEGSGKLSGTLNGNLREVKTLRFYDFFKKEFAFTLRIKDGELKIKGRPLVVKQINGLLAINETLYTDSLYFKILDNDFLITGEASNLSGYFSSQGNTSIMAELNSNSVDLNQLSPLFFDEASETKNPSYKFPDRLNLFLNLQLRNFSVGKFNAKNIKGSLNYKPKMFSLHEISFQSMQGEIKIGGVIVQDYKNDFIVKCQSSINNLDINQLFYTFNNFGQTFLPEKNIKGQVSGDIYFSSVFSDKIEINKKTIVSESNILIQNGELVNYEPMKNLSRFIDVKELEHITFSTLRNQITIKDEQVIIPKMDINSSAIDITIYGNHNFDNTFDYHFKVLLSDILAKKAKNTAREKNEFDNVEDDGLGKTNIYLKITGTPDDYKVSFDRKQARNARKEELQNEKSQLKQILNEEFGWFKNDSSIKSNDSSIIKKDKAFEIEWEDSNKSNQKNKKEDTKKADPAFKITFDEDTTSIHGNLE